MEANGYIGDVVIDGGTAYRLPAVPVQFDGQPPALRRAPEHGEDTEALLLELGYGWDDISRAQGGGGHPLTRDRPPAARSRRAVGSDSGTAAAAHVLVLARCCAGAAS